MTVKQRTASEAGRILATPVVRQYALPNGDKIVSLRADTFRSAVSAANSAMKKERSVAGSLSERTKRD